MKQFILRYFFYLLATIASSFCFSSCSSEELEPMGPTRSETFITNFTKPYEMALSVESDSIIKCVFNGENINEGDAYRSLLETAGDHDYNKYFLGPVKALSESIKRVRLFTVNDFGSAHVADTEITDIANLIYGSYKEYISSGYGTSIISKEYSYHSTHLPVICNQNGGLHITVDADTVFTDGLFPVSPSFLLTLKKRPAKTGDCKLHVYVETDVREYNSFVTLKY